MEFQVDQCIELLTGFQNTGIRQAFDSNYRCARRQKVNHALRARWLQQREYIDWER